MATTSKPSKDDYVKALGVERSVKVAVATATKEVLLPLKDNIAATVAALLAVGKDYSDISNPDEARLNVNSAGIQINQWGAMLDVMIRNAEDIISRFTQPVVEENPAPASADALPPA